jgi:type 1 glutamine amidotransferase
MTKDRGRTWTALFVTCAAGASCSQGHAVSSTTAGSGLQASGPSSGASQSGASLPSSGVSQSGASPPSSGVSTGAAEAEASTDDSGQVPADSPDAGAEASVAPDLSDVYGGPFNILVLSKTLGFRAASIPACQQMLRELGRCVDQASCATTGDVAIESAKPGSSFHVDVAGAPASCQELPLSAAISYENPQYEEYVNQGCDGHGIELAPGELIYDDPVSHFNATNLAVGQFHAGAPRGPYQMIFFCSPTGTVFTSDGTDGAAGMVAIQKFIEAGGAYGGLNLATDFEDTVMFPWYTNELVGAWFLNANNDGTPGSIVTVSQFAQHPVMRGIPNPWPTVDRWLLMNQPPDMAPGIQVLATVTGIPLLQAEPANRPRPVVWVKQFQRSSDSTGTYEGRMFYTTRAFNSVHFGEPLFRQLVHQGILWAAHRLTEPTVDAGASPSSGASVAMDAGP